ncbi:hypothetical protein [Methanococcus maripaludis]|uniref:Glycosyltransferase RgtA/B/C/D-like domain-containing protein n=2 Tax=Methanococcus maripaludis TaxID=39152 RepID=A0A7J9PGD2_METMI|nr:hypothetical protein [Methanococcus maripaludis]MBA2861806.1 hypothetical protein [Methanococcus maripaludis]
MGSVNHILSGGNPFESSSMVGGLPGYLALYGILCAGFCKLCSLDAFNGMIYFSLTIFAFGSFIWYYTFKRIFKDEWTSVIGVVLTNGISMYPILKYTEFTIQIMIPLFILAIYLVFTSKKSFNYAFLGLIYGLLAISHNIAFVGATLIIATFLIYEICKKYSSDKINGLREYFKENLKNFGVFFIFGLPISILYWYRPLFVYKLHQVNNFMIWGVSLNWYNSDVQIEFIFDVLRSLINVDSLYSALVSVFLINGLVQMYKTRTNSQCKFLKIFGIGCIFATFSYFITIPLLNMHFFPNYMSKFYLVTLCSMICIYGLNSLKNTKIIKNHHLRMNLGFTSLFILLMVLTSNIFVSNMDDWSVAGKNPFPNSQISLYNYLLENTSSEDTILSTKGLSYFIIGTSGRKLLVNHWAQQNDPYLDLSERDIDAAIILYGNNTEKKLELIEKYNVKYIYWDYRWNSTEYQFVNGSETPKDPLIAFYKEKYKKQLEEYGIKYTEKTWWVDIYQRNAQTLDLLMISPENYRNSIKPWTTDLDPYLEEVWNYSSDGQKVAILYKLNIE